MLESVLTINAYSQIDPFSPLFEQKAAAWPKPGGIAVRGAVKK
jgi:hypothetical protein